MERESRPENNKPSLPEMSVTVIDWKIAAQHVGDLHSGDLITGFANVDELDIFANNVGLYLQGEKPTLELPDTLLTHTGRPIYDGWNKSSMPPSQGIRIKKFHGDLENIVVLLLDDEQMQTNDVPRKRFVIAADTHTTGKSIKGKVAIRCSIGIHNRYKSFITALYKKLPEHSADAVAETIFKESQETAEVIIKYNLMHIFPGGIPGQGQRI